MDDHSFQSALLTSFIKNAARRAFHFGETSLTYAQLAREVSVFQQWFLQVNPQGAPIGIIDDKGAGAYIAILACMLSGITYVPVEPSHPDERNHHIVQLSGMQFIYCMDTAVLQEGFYKAHRKKFLTHPDVSGEAVQPVTRPTEAPVYILFTSGTTGMPKGVPVSSGNLDAFIQAIPGTEIGITAEDRFLQVFDLTFDLSVFSFLLPLLHGSCVYVLPKLPFRYMYGVRWIEQESITHVFTVPSFISYIAPHLQEVHLPSVRHWLFCGEALKKAQVQEWQHCIPHATIYNLYGPTEATIFCTSYMCSRGTMKDHHGVVCIGIPVEGTRLALFDGDEKIEAPDKAGELCIAGSQLTKGYLNAELNPQAFFEYRGERFYRTGDCCFADEEGNYFFEGRRDSQVKISGYRIELGEIENAALTVRNIQEAVAVVHTASGAPCIFLFVVSAGDYFPGDLKDALLKKLPDYMFPHKIILMEKLFYNLNGKIDRAALLRYAAQEETKK